MSTISRTSLFATSPTIAAFAWLTTLLTLLTLWLKDGRPKYRITSPDVSFISNIGAFYKTVFIVGTLITAIFYLLTLIQFVLVSRKRSRSRNIVNNNINGNNSNGNVRIWADIIALLSGIISATSLALLAIFDSFNYENAHWIFTLLFSFTAIITAIFNLIALSTLKKSGRWYFASFYLKIIFIILGSIILVSMIALLYSCKSITDRSLTDKCNDFRSVSASMEWILGLLFFVLFGTWILDFYKN